MAGKSVASSVEALLAKLASVHTVDIFQKIIPNETLLAFHATLLSILAGVDDAEEKVIQSGNSSMEVWLHKVRDAVWRANIDLSELSWWYGMACNDVFFPVDLFRQLFELFEPQMKEVIEQLELLASQKRKLGLKEASGKEVIFKWLAKDDKQLSVISIVGFYWMGKARTVLAQYVYDDPRMLGEFDIKAWVHVSAELDLFKITKKILEAVTESFPALDDEHDERKMDTTLRSCYIRRGVDWLTGETTTGLFKLQAKLMKKLTGKRILLVLNDVWNKDCIKWGALQIPFCYIAPGSKILVTTHSTEVASAVQSNKVLLEELWFPLFAEHLFQNENPQWNLDLEEIGPKELPLVLELKNTLTSKIRAFSAPEPKSSKSERKTGKTRRESLDFSTEEPIIYKSKMNIGMKCPGAAKTGKTGRESGAVSVLEKEDTVPPRVPSYNLEFTGHVYGRQKEKDQVVEFLLLDTSDSTGDNTNTSANMSVLAIVGPGGIGKTTLAHAVYEDHEVKAWFKLRIWVTFPSYQLDAETLAKIMLRILEIDFDKDDQLEYLMPRLQKTFGGRRFLLVLDSCLFVNNWEILQTCFKSAARGSAIVLTTRTTEAAVQMHADHVLHLSFLSMEHCWSLFSEHCFGNQSLHCSPQLEAKGKRILNKSRGVPLAVKMLGGLLHKKDYNVWEDIRRSQQLDSTNLDLPAPFVRLCYLDLPEQLKRCIIYLAMFPKGYKFQKSQVVPLWMAQDLIRQGNSETMKELGNEYFDFLVARSFLITSQIGGSLDFTMHDMVHDFALSKSAKFPFGFDGNVESINISCLMYDKQNLEETSSEPGGPGTQEDNQDIPLKHNTAFLDQQSPAIEVNIPTHTNDADQNTFDLGTHFETLKIVDASQLVKLPSTLHCVRIEGCYFLESLQDVLLGRSTNLFELYVIDCCSLKYLTDGWYPSCLRILYVHKCRKLEFFRPIEKMQNFDFLVHLFIGSSCDSLRSFPLNLFPKVKILCIWDCLNLQSLSIEESENSNLSLESLEIRDCSNLVSFPAQGLHSPCLRSLSVSNCKSLRSLPNYMTTLTSLQSVFIVKCPELESLPTGGLPSCLTLLSIAFCDKLIPRKEWNLKKLHCLRCFEIESGCMGLKSFPEKDLFSTNLNSLYISKLPSLEVLDYTGLQQLTALESLEIHCCEKLCSLPKVLPSSLTSLCIKESSMLTQKLLNRACTDWFKISHICNIQIDDNVISKCGTGASFVSKNMFPVSSKAKRTS